MVGDDMIRVFLLDGQVIFREGMHFILDVEEDVEVVAEATSLREALPLLEELPVDVLVMNVEEGIDRVIEIADRFPSLRLILVSERWHREQLAVARKLGASYFVKSKMAPEHLVSAIKRAGGKVAPVAPGDQGTLNVEQAVRAHLRSLVDSL